MYHFDAVVSIYFFVNGFNLYLQNEENDAALENT